MAVPPLPGPVTAERVSCVTGAPPAALTPDAPDAVALAMAEAAGAGTGAAAGTVAGMFGNGAISPAFFSHAASANATATLTAPMPIRNSTAGAQVFFDTVMVGNFDEKSLARSAIFAASLRATLR